MKNKTGKRLIIATNDIQRKFDETRAAEAKRVAAGHVATAADRAKDPYLSEDSIVYEAAKHTATPWKIDENTELPLAVIKDDDFGRGICGFEEADNIAFETQKANAAFIVRACNAHYELLEALRDAAFVLERSQPTPEYLECALAGGWRSPGAAAKAARTAIAKAEGREL